MIITKIQSKDNKRYEITTDEQFSFVLYKGELRLYKLKEGDEIPLNIYEEIFNNVLPKRAKLRAMNLLKVRPYTERELNDKLKGSGYPDQIVNVALDYVKGYGYVNDNQYALDYIYTYKDRKNKSRLTQDLLKKGVSKDIIDNALCDELGDEGIEYEKEQILSFIKKKRFDSNTWSYEEKMKLLASLYRKGYSMDLAKKLLDITSDYL